jgi:2-polyprenyl-3-methyl-5-hydroxy-6-metoxy-1,4-benzoquinol methylase
MRAADRCWVCASRSTVPWRGRGISGRLKPEDLQISDYRYGTTLALRKCQVCAFIFAEGRELETLTTLYEALADPEYEASQHARRLQMCHLLTLAKRFHKTARSVLDIGAATGLLVAEARRVGLEAVGVEPSHSLVETARRSNGVELLQGAFPHPTLLGRRFDLVFLVDVIEHVATPVQLLGAAAGALAPGGRLVLVTPDVGSVAARLLGRRWWHFRLAHVGYFSRDSLVRAIDAAGLTVVGRARAGWCFPVGYLATRAAVYLPISRLLKRAERGRWLGKLFTRVIPVNLRDSFLVLLQRKEDVVA